MTYPPQPGQPYPGQQPYPQQGGYHNQAPGYGQQYGQGFGGPPAPPPKNKTGLLIGIAIAAVVLIAVGVTGFVAPGFFLSKDNTAAGTGGPEAVAQQIVDGLNTKDVHALTALKCADAEKNVDLAIGAVSSVSDVKLGQLDKVSDSEYKAMVSLSINGKPSTTTGTIASAGDKWCWKLLSGLHSSPSSTKKSTTTRSPTSTRSSSTGTPSSGDGAAGVKNFIDKINAKDKAGAAALVCPGTEGKTVPSIEKATSSDSPAITATPSGSGNFITADIGGTYNGKGAGGILLARASGGTFCVDGFVVY